MENPKKNNRLSPRELTFWTKMDLKEMALLRQEFVSGTRTKICYKLVIVLPK